MNKEQFKTKHNLVFYSRNFLPLGNGDYTKIFKIGTCEGQYMHDDINKVIKIINIENTEKHNGHLDDVFEWFEYASKISKYKLSVVEFINIPFKKHCINKRGFVEHEDGNVYK